MTEFEVTIGSLGIGGKVYQQGDVVDLDPGEHAVKASVEAGDLREVQEDTVESLVNSHNRKELEAIARDLGIDYSRFSNKRQIAEAILENRG